ncbi:hypothetical protein [Bifidobacterium dentium]|uniref:Uncharacterized protein n=1 Tax=Bifidobacterium dentium JCVIHMP022 TaxID=553191 RepID=A0AB72Z1V3_9BIFI|nr:hypothetical protein [Bifidobacterium dentium]EFO78141.1 hypothetical protein HMPREF9003_0151 [Bifidobacterium dentium JCVIHMP022]
MNMDEFNSHFKNPSIVYCDNRIDEFTSTVEATLFSAKVETGADGPMVVLTAYAADSDMDADRIVWAAQTQHGAPLAELVQQDRDAGGRR